MIWANLHFLIGLGSKKIFLFLTLEFYPEWKEKGGRGQRGLTFLKGKTGCAGTALLETSGRSLTSGIREASSDTKMPCRKCSSGLAVCFLPCTSHDTTQSFLAVYLFPLHFSQSTEDTNIFYYLSSFAIHLLHKTSDVEIAFFSNYFQGWLGLWLTREWNIKVADLTAAFQCQKGV